MFSVQLVHSETDHGYQRSSPFSQVTSLPPLSSLGISTPPQHSPPQFTPAEFSDQRGSAGGSAGAAAVSSGRHPAAVSRYHRLQHQRPPSPAISVWLRAQPVAGGCRGQGSRPLGLVLCRWRRQARVSLAQIHLPPRRYTRSIFSRA